MRANMEGSDLPKGWNMLMSRSKQIPYYVNTVTRETQWERPTTEAKASDEQVTASHILVKHIGSRRPTSWRQKTITISKEEAIQKLLGLRKEIEDGSRKFDEIARAESDCSSAKNGGDLGAFGRHQMQKPFEEAAFALEVDAMSGIVDSESGVHIILRTK